MSDLISHLEGLDGPCRETDFRIWLALGDVDVSGPVKTTVVGGVAGRAAWECGSFGIWDDQLPAYTSSVDAALTLVKGGWDYGFLSDGTAFIWPDGGFDLLEGIQSQAVTPAIALCIASLRARSSTS